MTSRRGYSDFCDEKAPLASPRKWCSRTLGIITVELSSVSRTSRTHWKRQGRTQWGEPGYFSSVLLDVLVSAHLIAKNRAHAWRGSTPRPQRFQRQGLLPLNLSVGFPCQLVHGPLWPSWPRSILYSSILGPAPRSSYFSKPDFWGIRLSGIKPLMGSRGTVHCCPPVAGLGSFPQSVGCRGAWEGRQ